MQSRKPARFEHITDKDEAVKKGRKAILPVIVGKDEEKQNAYHYPCMVLLKKKQQLIILDRHLVYIWDISGKELVALNQNEPFSIKNSKINEMIALPDEKHLVFDHGNQNLSICDISGNEWQIVSTFNHSSCKGYEQPPEYVHETIHFWVSADSNRLFYRSGPKETTNPIMMWNISNKNNPQWYASLPNQTIIPKKEEEKVTGDVCILEPSIDSGFVFTHFESHCLRPTYWNLLWDIRTKAPKLLSAAFTSGAAKKAMAVPAPSARFFIHSSIRGQGEMFRQWDYPSDEGMPDITFAGTFETRSYGSYCLVGNDLVAVTNENYCIEPMPSLEKFFEDDISKFSRDGILKHLNETLCFFVNDKDDSNKINGIIVDYLGKIKLNEESCIKLQDVTYSIMADEKQDNQDKQTVSIAPSDASSAALLQRGGMFAYDPNSSSSSVSDTSVTHTSSSSSNKVSRPG